MNAIIVNGKTLELDEHGHLKHSSDWSLEVTHYFALQQNFELSDEAINLILFAREFYQAYGYIPPQRLFIKAMKTQFPAETANSHHLLQCFGDAPLSKLTLLAGLPKPKHCL